jgi:hypothetical protein
VLDRNHRSGRSRSLLWRDGRRAICREPLRSGHDDRALAQASARPSRSNSTQTDTAPDVCRRHTRRNQTPKHAVDLALLRLGKRPSRCTKWRSTLRSSPPARRARLLRGRASPCVSRQQRPERIDLGEPDYEADVASLASEAEVEVEHFIATAPVPMHADFGALHSHTHLHGPDRRVYVVGTGTSLRRRGACDSTVVSSGRDRIVCVSPPLSVPSKDSWRDGTRSRAGTRFHPGDGPDWVRRTFGSGLAVVIGGTSSRVLSTMALAARLKIRPPVSGAG